ncbi:MAG: hypothetical protein K5867_09500 [Bacteroidales bacterium]|nr:hypothetical protein [Bacteroidales bacterium]
MVILSISAGGAIAIIAVIGLATYAFYRRGKKVNSSQNSMEAQPTPAPQATLPNMARAQKAFMSNIDKFIIYFEGVTNIKVDWDKLSEAIIDINDDDLNKLLLIYKKNPTRWIDQMATWGVKPESCVEFTAMDKHKKQYTTKDGREIIAGKRYTVLSACWLITKTHNEGATIKEILKKGIVEEKQ